jgi:hypothetical protein
MGKKALFFEIIDLGGWSNRYQTTIKLTLCRKDYFSMKDTFLKNSLYNIFFCLQLIKVNMTFDFSNEK